MIIRRHYQFLNWWLDLRAIGVPPVYEMTETRAGVVARSMIGPDIEMALKKHRDRAVAMGREAGQEWDPNRPTEGKIVVSR